MAVLWPGDADPQLSEGLLVHSERAEVERIEEYRCQAVRTDRCRNVAVRLKSGPDDGERFVLRLGSGGLDPELEVGDQVRVAEGVVPAGEAGTTPGVGYTLTDFERRSPMLLLAIVFAVLVLVFGRLRGALSLAGLGASLAIVLVFVVPAILDGKSPLVVALVGSLAIMLVTIALAHGTGPKSLAAMLGTAVSLALTVLLALAFGEMTNLTGLSSEEAFIVQTGTGVSLEGLLLAGIVIGALGVLDDVTVSQSSTVLALRTANPTLGFRALSGLAMRVGRDHVSATVNTLVLAYVGASLPLLLIFSSGTLPFFEVVNLELIAKEIVATLVGSIGLIAAVPITTGLTALLAVREPPERLAGMDPVHAH
ncbi:MAG TPA: YibE/F family protein [Thermoleophilaceae bacterium]|nr:YibE/F family protein [Thermoleophilaceae bacterium]